jgi:hypothetical protein
MILFFFCDKGLDIYNHWVLYIGLDSDLQKHDLGFWGRPQLWTESPVSSNDAQSPEGRFSFGPFRRCGLRCACRARRLLPIPTPVSGPLPLAALTGHRSPHFLRRRSGSGLRLRRCLAATHQVAVGFPSAPSVRRLGGGSAAASFSSQVLLFSSVCVMSAPLFQMCSIPTFSPDPPNYYYPVPPSFDHLFVRCLLDSVAKFQGYVIISPVGCYLASVYVT